MTSVDNQQPSLLTEEGSEIKDNNSNVIIERLTTKKRTAWNKGLTKETDSRVKKNATNSSKTKQANILSGQYSAWNKGLTKEADSRVAKNVNRAHDTLRNRYRQGKLSAWNKGKSGMYNAWNKGLTKETDSRVAKNAEGTSETRLILFQQGRLLPNKRSRKGGYKEDLGHSVRSPWEANFARILKLMGVTYIYESQIFELPRKGTYHPDFYLPELDRYVEIKGYWDFKSLLKVTLFFRAYPNIELCLIGEREYEKLKLKFSPLILNWEY